MNSHSADIVIFGAGIAGLWLHHRLRKSGYNSLLLEASSIGGGQSIASQGILHSGLKYAFAGKVNKLAQSISAMPDRWRACLRGDGEIDLSQTRVATESQLLLIPAGFMGGLVKLVTQKVLGGRIREISENEWPEHLKESGFRGQVIYMDEPVLDVPSLVHNLAEPYRDSIKQVNWGDVRIDGHSISIGDHSIKPKHIVFTAAGSNHDIAKQLGHDGGLKTQARPLLMGMLRPAPFEIYAHLVGASDKPVATITTHKDSNGELVWYLGGSVAERDKRSAPAEVSEAAMKGFKKYLPKIDLSRVRWDVLPIDRIEGRSDTDGWMPDTPTLHTHGTIIYAWPTKLTFAPMLADKVFEKLSPPSGTTGDWAFLPEAAYSKGPWDE